MEDPSPTPEQPDATVDGRYMVLVGGLLVLICLTSVVLWFLERRRRSQAEADLVEMANQVTSMRQMLAKGGALGGLMVPPPAAAGLPQVDRDQLASWTVTLDGQDRRVLLLSANQGRELGLHVGDLVWVCAAAGPPGSPPDTQPANPPTPAPPAPAGS